MLPQSVLKLQYWLKNYDAVKLDVIKEVGFAMGRWSEPGEAQLPKVLPRLVLRCHYVTPPP